MSGHFEHLWIYITAPVIGALLAIMIWSVLKTNEGVNQQGLN
jgi:glycerol uptake facilitator-like aquaporin